MLSRKQKHIMLKFFSLFSVVRGYNILVIILAQYLTSIYILAPNLPLGDVLFDINVLMLVLSSAAAIAAAAAAGGGGTREYGSGELCELYHRSVIWGFRY